VHPTAVLGADGSIDVRISDAGTGLKRSRVELESEGVRTVLLREEYPAASWRTSTTYDTTVSVPVSDGKRKVSEGPAIIRVYAEDYSWLRWFRSRAPLLEHTVTIDLTPPTLEVLSSQHYLNQGGAEFVLYRTSSDAARSGVVFGDYFFPGTAGLFADPEIYGAFFAVAQDVDPRTAPKVMAEDAAGNRRAAGFHAVIKARAFPTKTLRISDRFLESKVPEILAASRLPEEPDLVKGYLYVNREMRRDNEARIREATRTSAPAILWTDVFLRQPNAAPSSGFGDRRRYLYEDAEIDAQTHLGVDLASVRQAEVVAVNAGTVVFAEMLGIYGEAVILDHGLGVFSLYGHLSSIKVTVGQHVERGATIGRTGETGLAGGDHLHFSMMIYGVHVDPAEWWDRHWLQNHVQAKLDAYPLAPAGARDAGD
jgi:murein DD-endopeptidase MepM/ murein hydrolase activator NlpD